MKEFNQARVNGGSNYDSLKVRPLPPVYPLYHSYSLPRYVAHTVSPIFYHPQPPTPTGSQMPRHLIRYVKSYSMRSTHTHITLSDTFTNPLSSSLYLSTNLSDAHEWINEIPTVSESLLRATDYTPLYCTPKEQHISPITLSVSLSLLSTSGPYLLSSEPTAKGTGLE